MKSKKSSSKLILTSALSTFAGTLSDPANLLFFKSLIFLRISFFVGMQHLIGRLVVARGISDGFAGAYL
ncbi:hypothetical protein DPMN_155399 [Dreissena polymorpha]|uniref:Uncharacterized protein n=1 Tax=Dreissena polymorpha TaxID=45954 RepID=A0A9D4JAV6_DREPO|nr:hypothetical protein DPMN_155399 [Dreissena polymorpha]